MKGLILKDFINLKKNMKIFSVFILLYGFMAFTQKDASFFNSIFTLVFAFLILSTYSFDEMAKWDGYALTMPISKDNIIQGKYLMMLLLTFLGFSISMIITVVLNTILKKEDILVGWQVSGFGACLVILFYCITIPFITKLGIEKARLIFFAVYFIPFAVGYILNKAMQSGSVLLTDNVLNLARLALDYIYLLLPLFVMIALWISYTISVAIYQKKEF
jgi:ABC-2 type transport system permease protein